MTEKSVSFPDSEVVFKTPSHIHKTSQDTVTGFMGRGKTPVPLTPINADTPSGFGLQARQSHLHSTLLAHQQQTTTPHSLSPNMGHFASVHTDSHPPIPQSQKDYMALYHESLKVQDELTSKVTAVSSQLEELQNKLSQVEFTKHMNSESVHEGCLPATSSTHTVSRGPTHSGQEHDASPIPSGHQTTSPVHSGQVHNASPIPSGHHIASPVPSGQLHNASPIPSGNLNMSPIHGGQFITSPIPSGHTNASPTYSGQPNVRTASTTGSFNATTSQPAGVNPSALSYTQHPQITRPAMGGGDRPIIGRSQQQHQSYVAPYGTPYHSQVPHDAYQASQYFIPELSFGSVKPIGKFLPKDSQTRRPLPKAMNSKPYNGLSDWYDYLQSFNHVAVHNGWSSAEAVRHLYFSLEGDALARCYDLGDSLPDDFDYFVNLLTERFVPAASRNKALIEFRNRKKRSHESYHSFAHDLRRLNRRAYPTGRTELAREQELIDQFKIGIADNSLVLHTISSGKPLTLTDAAKLAEECDGMQVLAGHRYDTSVQLPPTVASVAPPSDDTSNSDSEIDELVCALRKFKSKKSKSSYQKGAKVKQERSSSCSYCKKVNHHVDDCYKKFYDEHAYLREKTSKSGKLRVHDSQQVPSTNWQGRLISPIIPPS